MRRILEQPGSRQLIEFPSELVLRGSAGPAPARPHAQRDRM
jgi:hypothetical protein